MFKLSELIYIFAICSTVKGGVSRVQLRRPDYEFHSSVNGFLSLHRIPASWHEARLRCYYEGGVLASPYSENFLVAMQSLMMKENLRNTIYTGIHAQFSPGDFASVDGIPLYRMLHLKWDGESNNPNGYSELKENCLIMDRDGEISDVHCDNRHPYICYQEQNANHNVCGSHDKEYVYYNRTNSCYKVHTIGRTWSRGFMTCQAEGGHMAIINSKTEAQVISELLQKYPEHTIFADYKHVASIGYQNWGERGSWWTIHGQELTEAGYAIWDEHSPDNKNSQFCGGVNRNGKLNDIWCNNFTFPLICEMPAIKLQLVDLSNNGFSEINVY